MCGRCFYCDETRAAPGGFFVPRLGGNYIAGGRNVSFRDERVDVSATVQPPPRRFDRNAPRDRGACRCQIFSGVCVPDFGLGKLCRF